MEYFGILSLKSETMIMAVAKAENKPQIVVIAGKDRGWLGGQRRRQVAGECRFKRANNGPKLQR